MGQRIGMGMAKSHRMESGMFLATIGPTIVKPVVARPAAPHYL